MALVGATLLSDYAETKRSTTMAQFLSINRDLLSTESVRRGAMLELDHKSSEPPNLRRRTRTNVPSGLSSSACLSDRPGLHAADRGWVDSAEAHAGPV